MQKALLNALLTPDFSALQNENNWTELLVRAEEMKTLPFGEVWAQYCAECGVPNDGEWLPIVQEYERTVLVNRV